MIEPQVLQRQINEAAAYVKSRLPLADTAVVLGSGLGDFPDGLSERSEIAYTEIPHFPQPTVPGHSGKLYSGVVGGRRILALSGRFHYYEGHDPQTVVLAVRVLHQLGVKTLLLTNAAGGVNAAYSAGDLMLISDHINLCGYNPLRGLHCAQWGERFPDMTCAYDKELRELARQVAKRHDIELREGVYCGLAGPSFETPAEIRMLALLGADAVGMSTVPETIAARQSGMRVLGVSCITNMAAGISPQPLTHQEVMDTGRAAMGRFITLISGVIEAL
ncbi:MAG: purine-nucleoside phosphorylase [Bacillota bacterium]|nr:purine-nucleoside phosphorylase [Bacillota bacterium]